MSRAGGQGKAGQGAGQGCSGTGHDVGATVPPCTWLWGAGQAYWIALRHRRREAYKRRPPAEVGGLSFDFSV